MHMFELLKYGVSAVAHLNADFMVNQLPSSFILHPCVSRTRSRDQEVPFQRMSHKKRGFHMLQG